jgi:hypothetical protein
MSIKMKVLAVIITAMTAIGSASAQTAYPATNEEKGCQLLSEVTGGDSTREGCQGLVATVKKNNNDTTGCVISAMMMRMAYFNEPVDRRPAGLTLVAMNACAMMTGVSESAAEKVLTDMCVKSRSPQFVSECRGSGYRS